MPKVSVILPAYNPGAFIREAIQSVLDQTFKDIEIIVIDDGSTEDLSWTADTFPHVKLIRQQNCGVAMGRNTGIAASTGTYVALLDQDDVWLPGKLAEQVRILDADPECGLCHTQFQYIDEKGNRGGIGYGGGMTSYEELLTGCGILVSTVVVRRELLQKSGVFNPLHRYAGDHDFFLRVARCSKIVAIRDTWVLYRIHATNESHKYQPMFREDLQILKRHLLEAKADQRPDHAAIAADGMHRVRFNCTLVALRHAKSAMKKASLGSFLKHLSVALRCNPGRCVSAVYKRLLHPIQ